jgi:hypothetical protein
MSVTWTGITCAIQNAYPRGGYATVVLSGVQPQFPSYSHSWERWRRVKKRLDNKVFNVQKFQELMRHAPPRGPRGSPENLVRQNLAAIFFRQCWEEETEEVKE